MHINFIRSTEIMYVSKNVKPVLLLIMKTSKLRIVADGVSNISKLVWQTVFVSLSDKNYIHQFRLNIPCHGAGLLGATLPSSDVRPAAHIIHTVTHKTSGVAPPGWVQIKRERDVSIDGHT